MSRPVIVRREAEADIHNSYLYLQDVRVGLGDQFAARLADVFQRIEAMPELYGVVWQDVRAVRVRRFQYVVYYVPFADRVEIITVMHGAREPSTWQSRIS